MDGLKGIIQRLIDERDACRQVELDARYQADALSEAIQCLQLKMDGAPAVRHASLTAHDFEAGSVEAYVYGAVVLERIDGDISWSLDGLYQEIKYSVPTTTKSRILTILRKYKTLYHEDEQGKVVTHPSDQQP